MGALGPIGRVCQDAHGDGSRGAEYRISDDRRNPSEGTPDGLQPPG